MENRRPAILVLAEDRAIRENILDLLADTGLAATTEDSPNAILVGCRARISTRNLTAAVSISRAASTNSKAVRLIVITSQGSEGLAIEVLRAGMVNYLRLPLTPPELARALETTLSPAPPYITDDRMIGNSQAFQDVKQYLCRVAACDSNVLITGETGTGKELAADFVHRHSARTAKPFIAINCAALPDSLIESELFGFDRGAFTGAHMAQEGKFKLADKGDVFLDEVGDLSAYAQAKILRVIETGEIQRLGGRRPQRADVRIIAATNRDLESDPTFRKDLYFRLNVATVHLPPLRERKGDILLLANSFRAEFDRKFGCTTVFTNDAKQLLLSHHWPGNIRELRNIVEAAFVDPGPDAHGALDLPRPFRNAFHDSKGSELERILLALSQTNWNKSRAASELHWSRMTLYRKLARYKLRQPVNAGI